MYVYNQNDTSGAKSRAMRFVQVGHVTNKLFKKKINFALLKKIKINK